MRLSAAALGAVLVGGLGLQAQGQDQADVWWSVIDSIPPGVSVIAVDSLYGFEADSRQEIALAMRTFGPVSGGEDWFGWHQAHWRYHYDWERNEAGACRPAEVTILLRSVITMPHLYNADSLGERLRREWTAYTEALREHEEGHREIARQQLVQMRAELLDMAFTTCAQSPEIVQMIADRNGDDLRKRQAAYDAETDHGRTQGASWPPRRGGGGGLVQPSPLPHEL